MGAGVLIVDDDQDLREILARLVRKEGFTPLTAADCSSALELLGLRGAEGDVGGCASARPGRPGAVAEGQGDGPGPAGNPAFRAPSQIGPPPHASFSCLEERLSRLEASMKK